jgi:putative FmdB family regulatory protein
LPAAGTYILRVWECEAGGIAAVPIYEYQCTKCGEVFEAFQKISDKPLTQCRFCNSRVEKLISQSSFQLKGSGWYLTDYARGKEASKAGEKETKPAAKTDKGTPSSDSGGSAPAKKE